MVDYYLNPKRVKKRRKAAAKAKPYPAQPDPESQAYHAGLIDDIQSLAEIVRENDLGKLLSAVNSFTAKWGEIPQSLINAVDRKAKAEPEAAQQKPQYPGLNGQIKDLANTAYMDGAKAGIDRGRSLVAEWREQVGNEKLPAKLCFTVGLIALKGGLYDEAHEFFDMAIANDEMHHSAMMGKADCFMREGKIKSALHWSTQAFALYDGKGVAARHLGILYAAGEFEKVGELLEPYLEAAVNQDKIHGWSCMFLSLHMALRKPEHDEEWIRVYKNIAPFDKPAAALGKIKRTTKALREIHKPIDPLEQALTSGNAEERRRAEQVLNAYSKGGFFWNVIHSSIAANYDTARATGVMGLVHGGDNTTPPGIAKWAPVPRLGKD